MYKTNWGVVIIDALIIVVAAYTRIWPILLILLVTGSYQFNKE